MTASEEVLDEPELGYPKFPKKAIELTDKLLKVALKLLARKPKAAVGLGCMFTQKTVSATHADWAVEIRIIFFCCLEGCLDYIHGASSAVVPFHCDGIGSLPC